jgi:hypothetical protein
MPDVLERPLDSGVTPRRILFSHPHDQLPDFEEDATPARLSRVRPLPRDHLPMPSQERIPMAAISREAARPVRPPRGTPAAVVRALDDAISKALTEPSFVSFAEQNGSTVDYKSAEAFAAEPRQAFVTNGDLIRH